MNGVAPSPRRRSPIRPAGITVLYDAACPICRQARRWVERHHQLVPVHFVAAGSDLAVRRFPRLDVDSTLEDVTVITDEGAVLRGDRAWIAVLWSVARTRGRAAKLANGRGRRMFGGVKGATEAIRRLAAGQADPPTARGLSVGWPPPDEASRGCETCRT